MPIDPILLEQKKRELREQIEASIADRIELDDAYLSMIELWAKRSCATRSKVGAFLVKNNRIISDGYNGLPSGMPNEEVERIDEETGLAVTSPYMIHAEANCFDKLAREAGGNAEGATMYSTLSPCLPCSMRAVNVRIKRAVYRHEYRDTEGLELMRARGIIVDHIPYTKVHIIGG